MSKTLHRTLLLVALIAGIALPWTSALADTPRKAEQMLADARVLLARGDDLAALTKVAQAAELAPDWAPPHASLALIYQRQANEPLALEHLARYQLLGLVSGGAHDCRLTRDIAEGEALMIYLVNVERAQHGLSLLLPDSGLSAVARGHAQEMATLEYFSHDSPTTNRRTPNHRFRLAYGFDPLCIGENLARMASNPLWSFNLDNLRESHARLMLSDTHRGAILWDRPTHIGVGIAVNARGDYWIDQTFVRFN